MYEKRVKIISNGFERKLEDEINKELEAIGNNLIDVKFFVGQDGWRYSLLIYYKEVK